MRAALLALLLSAAPCGAAEPILGFNFPVWWVDAYQQPWAMASYRGMKDMGAGWVAIVPTVFVRDSADSEVLATEQTASDDSLRAAIRAARARGLKVLFKPHVDMLTKLDRMRINPDEPDKFFAAYRSHMLRYARLAAEEKCDMLSVGTELALLTLPKHTPAWRSLIGEIRGIFPGPLTYAANWHSVSLPGFWKDLDFIGVDGYFPVPGGANRAALDAAWRPWVLEISLLAKLYGKPVLFTEIGLASQKGANLQPWNWRDFGELDLEVQAAYMDSFLNAFQNEPWFRGFLYWAWEADPARTGPRDKSMSAQGKPAGEVLRRAFQAGKAPPPPPPGWLDRLQGLSLGLAGIRLP